MTRCLRRLIAVGGGFITAGSEARRVNGPRAWLAEGISTYALVFFGSISVVLAVAVHGGGEMTSEGLILISLSHGGIIAIMVYAFGHVSGAHINPAVTIPMVITGKLGLRDGIAYVASQVAGAVIASATIAVILPSLASTVAFAGHTGPSDLLEGSVGSAFLVEVVLTFFLVLAIFMGIVHKRAPAGWHGFIVGGVITIIHLVGVPLTGASVNPARSFGPAVFSGMWEFHWLYWVAPIVGGIIAGVLAKYVYVAREEREDDQSEDAGSP